MFKAMRSQLGSVVIALMLGCLPVQMIMLMCETVSAQSIQPKSSLLAKKAASYREMRKNEADRLRDLARAGRPFGGLTYPEREKRYRQALTIYQEIRDRKNEIEVLIRLAELDAVRFRHSKAVQTLRLAIQTAKLSGDPKSELEVLLSEIDSGDLIGDRIPINNIYEYLIRRDPLSTSFDEYLTYIRSSDNHYNRCSLIGRMGDAYFEIKLYDQALSAYKKAILECRRDVEKFKYITRIGTTYKLMGQELKAQRTLDEALSFYKGKFSKNTSYFDRLIEHDSYIRIAVAKNSDKLLQIIFRWKASEYVETLIDIGDAYKSIENYELALSYYKQAVYLQESSKGTTSYFYKMAKLLHKIARMHVHLGNDSDALKTYLLALNKVREVREYGERLVKPSMFPPSYGVGLLIDIGNFYMRKGEKDKANTFYKEADEILRLSYQLGWAQGETASVSIISDEDDLDKLLSASSGDRKPEPTTQEMQKYLPRLKSNIKTYKITEKQAFTSH